MVEKRKTSLLPSPCGERAPAVLKSDGPGNLPFSFRPYQGIKMAHEHGLAVQNQEPRQQ